MQQKAQNTDIVGNVIVNGQIHNFNIELIGDKYHLFVTKFRRAVYKVGVDLVPFTLNEWSEKDAQEWITNTLIKNIQVDQIISVHFVPLKYLFNNQQVTDIMLYGLHNGEYKIVLAKRKYPPMGLALFGGMVEKNETAASNTKKEIEEEANIKMDENPSYYIGTYDLKEVRGTLTTTFTIIDITNTIDTLQAGDDVTECHLYTLSEISDLLETNQVVPHHKFLIQKGIDFIKLTL